MSLVSKRFHLSENDKATFTDASAVLQISFSTGTRALSPITKRPGHEANHSSHSSANVQSGARPPVLT
jgi:hypothetical protein